MLNDVFPGDLLGLNDPYVLISSEISSEFIKHLTSNGNSVILVLGNQFFEVDVVFLNEFGRRGLMTKSLVKKLYTRISSL